MSIVQSILHSTIISTLSIARNPLTGRNIKVNGETFNKVIDSGGYLFFQGEFMPLKFESSDNYFSIPTKSRNNETDAWYEICRNNDALFVYKPSKLLSVPGVGPNKTDSLSTRVAEKFPTAKICHRLDYDTSGIMIFGLNGNIHRDISKQFEDKSIQKTYTALVDGHVMNDTGRIDLSIGKEISNEGYNRWVIGGTKQRAAITDYKVLNRYISNDGHQYSKVSLKPLTGRGHQIRLHMKYIGHPLLGDTLHAPQLVAYSAPRLCLHAQSLSCRVNGEICHVEVGSVF